MNCIQSGVYSKYGNRLEAHTDYRLGHLDPGKGESYEHSFHVNDSRRWVWGWKQDVLKDILHEYFMLPPQRCLDFACGTGRITEFLVNYVEALTGVDVSDSMLAVAREKPALASVRLLNMDITRENGLDDCRFDLITAFRFFLNAQPELKREAMLKLSQLLAEDGVLVFDIHMNTHSLEAMLTRIYQAIRHFPYSNQMSIKEARSLTEMAGLKVVQTYHYRVIPLIREHPKLPYRFIDRIERVFAKAGCLRRFSTQLVFVCKKQIAAPKLPA